MNFILFIVISFIYITSLALIDGLFNRLIFREIKQFPYESKEKKNIYQLPEWKYIGLILLIVLPIIIPIITTYALGEIIYTIIYLILLLLIQWDVIFGKLVFNKWLGDTPSICLPYIGWIQQGIVKTIIIRLILSAILIYILLTMYPTRL